ncbi:MAG: polyketide cyclase, partial [Myxococcota bacterium]
MSAPKLDVTPMIKPHWTEEECRNVDRIAEFIQLLMNNHDFDAVLECFGSGPYIQHNRNIPDSIPGLLGYVKEVTER